MNAIERAMRSTSPACSVCSDLKVVLQKNCRDTARCPRCGSFNEDSYRSFRAAHFEKVNSFPEITQSDLSADEATFYLDQVRAGHNKITVLGWIEGRRYDPSRDDDFVELVNETVCRERGALEK